MNRRTFLAASAGLLAAGPLAFARAPRPRAASPNARLGLGFIGMGIQNRGHLNWALKHAGVQVIGVCDVDTTRRTHAKATADTHYANAASASPGVSATKDYHELLARPDIDAVVISTPDHWHINMILDAAAAKKDIYCEKPLTLTLAESRLAIEAVRKHGVVLQTGSQQRTEHDGRFRQAVDFVRQGRIGTLLSVNVGIGVSATWCDLPEEAPEPGLDWDKWLGPAPVRPYNSILSPRGVHDHYPAWRAYREYSGGYITDWGAHHLDIVQWALSADSSGPIRVLPPHNSQANRGGKLIYANGVEVTHGGPEGITFVGTTGELFVDRGTLWSRPDHLIKEPPSPEGSVGPGSKDHRQNWLDCIASRAKPECDVEIGARSIACAHLLNLAYWHQRPLTWNPQTWSFENDPEADTWRDYERRQGFQLPA